MANTNLNIPNSPFLDVVTGRPSQEWMLWLMNPQAYSISVKSGIGTASGGTGVTGTPQAGQLLIGTGSGYSLGNLGAGNGIAVTNGVGSVSVSNTGVLSFSGGSTGLLPSTVSYGDVVLSGVLGIGYGGTGATTANGAINALLPSQGGNSGKVLSTDGTNTSWLSVGGTGTVTNVSVVSANGFSGSVATSTTTPAITLFTSTSGILYGNAGALSAVTIGSGLSFAGGTLSSTGGGSGTVTSVSGTGTVNGLTLTGTVTTSGNLTLGGTLDLSAPPAIGGTTPAAGAFTTVTASASTSASANAGAIRYGTLSYSDTDIVASFATTSTSYAQMVLQNKSNGTAASTNFNVSNDAGTATTNFGEFGINSSTFTGTGALSAAGTTYLASASTDLAIGTYGANAIHFVVNSGATDAATISSAGLLTANNFASSSAAITGGSINSTTVGATTASTGAFTTLSANSTLTATNGAHSISSVNNTITITGGGASGVVNITSVGAGSMNGIAIGGTTPAAGTFTSLSATSRTATGVLATSAGQTANVTITNTVTYTTGGKTLATQTAAASSSWRVRAFGTFTAANSATARNAQVACFWGATQLIAITSTVLINTAQTTSFEVEFILTGSSTTAIWTAGYMLNRTNSATALAINNATPASTVVTSGAQTLDLRFSMSASVAGDSWVVQGVTMERLV